MFHRIFNTLSLISTLALGGTVVLWAWSLWVDDARRYCLSFSVDFHVAVQAGRVSFFNDREYGPYRGSIIAITSPELPIERTLPERQAFGETAGIYYRYFRWTESGAVLWTVSVSLAYPLIAFAILPAIGGWRWWRAG